MKAQLQIAIVLSSCLIATGCATIEKITENINLPTPAGKPSYTDFPETQVPHTLLRKPVASGSLSSKYGFRLNPAGIPFPKKHNGIDYRAEEGTSIFAAGDGVIVEKRVSSSYGNIIKISHDNGFSSLYAHMHSFAPTLEKGTEVSKGQVIGTVGSTGQSTGPHLHYELHYRGKKVNPLF